ncbi:MAG: histidine kinase, partial [Methylobacterium sp.]
MTSQTDEEPRRGPLAWPRASWDAIGQRASSSLTRRIVVLNLVGLIALLVGFLYLNQFRQGLIQARVQSLAIQGDIIAGAIASSASVDTGTIRIDPDKLLQQQAGEGSNAPDEESQPLAFSLNPEQVAPLLRRLVTPTGNRARVYDSEGGLLFDTRSLFNRPEGAAGAPQIRKRSLLERAFEVAQAWSFGLFGERVKPQEEVGPANGHSLREVQTALNGARGSLVRRNGLGETTVSVAVPIQRSGAVRGARGCRGRRSGRSGPRAGNGR